MATSPLKIPPIDPKNLISLANVDFNKQDLRLDVILNSPRSLCALKLTGIDAIELNPVNEKLIISRLREREHGKAVPMPIVHARIDAAHKLREQKLKLVL